MLAAGQGRVSLEVQVKEQSATRRLAGPRPGPQPERLRGRLVRCATRTARTMGSWYWPAAGLRARRACPAANTRFGFRVCRCRRCGFRQPAPSGSSRAPWPCYRQAGEPHCDVSPIGRPNHDSSCLAALRPGLNYNEEKNSKKTQERNYKVKDAL